MRGGHGPGLLVLDDLPVSLAEQRSAAAAVEAAAGVAMVPVDETGQVEGGRGALDFVHFGVKVGCVGDEVALCDRDVGCAR